MPAPTVFSPWVGAAQGFGNALEDYVAQQKLEQQQKAELAQKLAQTNFENQIKAAQLGIDERRLGNETHTAYEPGIPTPIAGVDASGNPVNHLYYKGGTTQDIASAPDLVDSLGPDGTHVLAQKRAGLVTGQDLGEYADAAGNKITKPRTIGQVSFAAPVMADQGNGTSVLTPSRIGLRTVQSSPVQAMPQGGGVIQYGRPQPGDIGLENNPPLADVQDDSGQVTKQPAAAGMQTKPPTLGLIPGLMRTISGGASMMPAASHVPSGPQKPKVGDTGNYVGPDPRYQGKRVMIAAFDGTGRPAYRVIGNAQ